MEESCSGSRERWRESHTIQANDLPVLVNEEFTRQGEGEDISGYGGDSSGTAKLQEGHGENSLPVAQTGYKDG